MCQDKRVEVLLHIRKLRGGSQSNLVRADDGFFYVVKFLDNLQGPNLLFNEVLGTEVFRGAGLPVPEWRAVDVSEDFIDRNPGCWMETEHGRRRPKSGECFGSRYLSLRNAPIFEILPVQSFDRIKNRKDFWTAWVLDALCEHTDNRQAVFLERNAKQLEAYFIDHGHLFGGPTGNVSPRIMASRYLDPRIYTSVCEKDAEEIQRALQKLDLTALSDVASALPEGWSNKGAISKFECFAHKISDTVLLKDAIRFILCRIEYAEESHDRSLAQSIHGFECEDLYASIPAPRVIDRVDGRSSDFIGDQRQFWPPSLQPFCPYGANF